MTEMFEATLMISTDPGWLMCFCRCWWVQGQTLEKHLCTHGVNVATWYQERNHKNPATVFLRLFRELNQEDEKIQSGMQSHCKLFVQAVKREIHFVRRLAVLWDMGGKFLPPSFKPSGENIIKSVLSDTISEEDCPQYFSMQIVFGSNLSRDLCHFETQNISRHKLLQIICYSTTQTVSIQNYFQIRSIVGHKVFRDTNSKAEWNNPHAVWSQIWQQKGNEQKRFSPLLGTLCRIRIHVRKISGVRRPRRLKVQNTIASLGRPNWARVGSWHRIVSCKNDRDNSTPFYLDAGPNKFWSVAGMRMPLSCRSDRQCFQQSRFSDNLGSGR